MQGLRLIVPSLAAGAAAAWGLSYFIRGLLFETDAADPLTFGVMIALLLVVALAGAIFLPDARRPSVRWWRCGTRLRATELTGHGQHGQHGSRGFTGVQEHQELFPLAVFRSHGEGRFDALLDRAVAARCFRCRSPRLARLYTDPSAGQVAGARRDRAAPARRHLQRREDEHANPQASRRFLDTTVPTSSAIHRSTTAFR